MHDVDARARLEKRQGLLETLPLGTGQGGGDSDGAPRLNPRRVLGEGLAGVEAAGLVMGVGAGGRARAGQRQNDRERERAEGGDAQ